MVNNDLDTTIRLKKETKLALAELDFVKKHHSYDNILSMLMNYYKTKKKFKGLKELVDDYNLKEGMKKSVK